jgi:hypothetical protein
VALARLVVPAFHAFRVVQWALVLVLLGMDVDCTKAGMVELHDDAHLNSYISFVIPLSVVLQKRAFLSKILYTMYYIQI